MLFSRGAKILIKRVRTNKKYFPFQFHSKITAPQLNPAPKPEAAIISPDLTIPFLTASSKARGIEAAEVFP